VAGSNLLFKEGQIVFKEGDPADGMYLIRRGELRVYLEKNGNEVKLASVGAGGMIGEMAFFDNKPRSASVKAGTEAELTKITPEDFAKLMKQIPKWFVSLMSSLSTRLRDTNDRLQKMENKQAGAKGAYEDVLKILHVVNLLMKDATKEGKLNCLNRATTEEQLTKIFGVQKQYMTDFFNVLVAQKIFAAAKDSYNAALLGVVHKVTIDHLTKFIADFIKNNPGQKCVPATSIEMLEVILKLANESAYETVNIALEDAVVEGERQSLVTSSWKNDLSFFKGTNDLFSLVKVSSGIGFKVNKKDMPEYISFHKVLKALADKSLA